MKKRVIPFVFLILLLTACGGTQPASGRRPASGQPAASEPPSSPASSATARTCPQQASQGGLVNLVVIAGNRANTYEMPASGRANEVFCDLVSRTFEIDGLEAQGQLAFVVSDGNPWQAQLAAPNGHPVDLRVTANNAYMLSQNIQNTVSNMVLPFMDHENFQARYSEADLLEAIWEGARILIASY